MRYFCLSVFFLTSCGVIDGDSTSLVGGYSVGWVDSKCSMQIYHGEKGLTEGQIYYVGWDERFIIAKRHPNCNNKLTDYFIVEVDAESDNRLEGLVHGPYNFEQFEQQRLRLKVSETLEFTLEP